VHAKSANRCAGIYGLVRNENHCEENVFVGMNEDCFQYSSYSQRNNVVVLFGTIKVQSFMLTEVKDCDLLIVVTSATFLKRKDMLKEKSS